MLPASCASFGRVFDAVVQKRRSKYHESRFESEFEHVSKHAAAEANFGLKAMEVEVQVGAEQANEAALLPARLPTPSFLPQELHTQRTCHTHEISCQ